VANHRHKRFIGCNNIVRFAKRVVLLSGEENGLMILKNSSEGDRIQIYYGEGEYAGGVCEWHNSA
jgi:hypothetical protein